MVGKYRTLDFDALLGSVENADGSKSFATLEEARKAIPDYARQLPFDRDHQFVRALESPDRLEN
jgi:hypothetical protein